MAIKAWVAALLLALACGAQARITALDIQSVKPFAGGHEFGAAGAYERVTGTARGELDPADVRNRGIVNLDRAPKNAAGRVEYEVEFDVLRPVNADKGNHKLLFDVTNRGRKFLLHWVMSGSARDLNNPQTLEQAGGALFLRQGWTMVWAGWDPDAPKANGGMTIKVPTAVNPDGSPIVRVIRAELVSGTRGPVVRQFTLSHEAASLDQDKATLTVRRRESDPRVPVPAAEWRLKDARTLEILTPGNAGAGPAVGSLYELHYPAKGPKVQGIGFAATRDLVSFLRYADKDDLGKPNPAGSGMKHALAVGISQSGRYLRDHIGLGFNQDESRRKVFDGVLSHIAGAGRVFLDYEFGEPARTNTQHEDHLYPENAFPFSAASMHDPVTRRSGSLLRGDGFDPLLIEVNTSTEYWQKGASLLHTDPAGTRDVALPPGARVYMVAGTPHGGRTGLGVDYGPCMNERNAHDASPALRALLVALDEWASRGVAPPDSRVPTIEGGTLVAPDNKGFPAIPDFAVARFGNEIVPFGDWIRPRPDPAQRYVALVAKTDADGNETTGILLPDVAVPLATYTGWNLYKRPFPENELCDRDGSYREFAATRAEREAKGDPRRSLEERYGTHEAFVRRLHAATASLVQARLLLPEDAEVYDRWAQSDAVAKRFK